MATLDDESLLNLLRAIADLAPGPLYPARFAQERSVERNLLDDGLDELRRRGLVTFTEWVKDLGQGYVLTDAGKHALASRKLTRAAAAMPAPPIMADASSYQRGEIVRRAIFDHHPGYVTRVLLIANLVYFGVGAAYASYKGILLADYLTGESAGTHAVLDALGGLWPFRLVQDQFLPGARPEYERILLSFFLHIGVLHLGKNMYFLVAMGRQIEAMWGWARFLTIYFVAGIVSGCAVLLIDGVRDVHPLQSGMTAGASGCLFGIFAAMVVWFSLNYEHLPPRLVQDWSRNTMFNAVLLIAINFVPGVSWQGHFGGAVGGLLAALLLQIQRFHSSRAVRCLALAGVAAVPVVFFLAVLWQEGRF